ncbi:MAG TPA: trigger factor, partial [Rubricoccaceae bacterium]
MSTDPTSGAPSERTTTIRALTAVDYALDVHVPAAALEPLVAEALKKQRGQMNLKGFRPGKVPLSVVRKMVGPQVAVEIAEQAIGEAFREAVAEPAELDVIGQPRLAELDFDPTAEGADLKAVVSFGVRPEIALADLDGVPVTRLVKAFTDDDVEADLQRRLDLAATEEDAPEGTALTAEHTAVVDITPVDADGERTGGTQTGARLVLGNPELRPEMLAALVGKTVGETARVELPHLHTLEEDGAAHHDEEHDHDDHTDRYDVTVTDVKVRVVPPLDEAFVREQTRGKFETVDELRTEVREELERSWEQRSKQALEGKMVDQFVAAHADIPVPEVLVEAALDGMLEETRQRARGVLPPTFDVEAFREEGRERAEGQVRWLLVKDALVREEGIAVADEDLDAEFARLAGDGGDAEMVRQYLQSQPQMMEQMADHLLNQRVFAALERRFTVVDKTREDL